MYWGAPGAYDRPSLAFSRAGLGPMVAALDRLAKDGAKTVKLGLFYDTSTLANDTRGAAPPGRKADLTTAAGQDLFCTTVTDYFAAIPAQHWARHRGGALVVLYVSAFAGKRDGKLGNVLRERFRERFAASGKKLDMGKSCIRFKQAEDLAIDAITEAVAAVTPDDYVAMTNAAHEGRRKR